MIWVRLPVYRLYLLILFRRISTWYSPQRDSTSHAYLLAYARSQSMYVTNKIRFRLFLWLRVYWVFQMVIRWWVISDGSYWGESQDCLVLSRIKLRSSYLWRQGDVHFVELHYQKKKRGIYILKSVCCILRNRGKDIMGDSAQRRHLQSSWPFTFLVSDVIDSWEILC